MMRVPPCFLFCADSSVGAFISGPSVDRDVVSVETTLVEDGTVIDDVVELLRLVLVVVVLDTLDEVDVPVDVDDGEVVVEEEEEEDVVVAGALTSA
jgi:hypothetical protein